MMEGQINRALPVIPLKIECLHSAPLGLALRLGSFRYVSEARFVRSRPSSNSYVLMAADSSLSERLPMHRIKDWVESLGQPIPPGRFGARDLMAILLRQRRVTATLNPVDGAFLCPVGQ